jgi:hypothetical protein
MTRAELEKAGFTKEQIDGIMAMHGKSIESIKATAEAEDTKHTAEITRINKELKEAAKAIEGFKSLDVEAIKKTADEFKTKFEKEQEARAKEQADHAAERKANERMNSAKEILAGLKPKSKLVEKAALADILAGMEDPKFKADKWAKSYVEENAADFGEEKAGGMRHNAPPANDDNAALRKSMGLKPAPVEKK